ncbi:ASCH domain-containing protein [Actinoplanes sp. NPDC024001]|uniref:ASCH domain-containing protein n=1 Tax=Actinoplanes sp. NPDC024001 TaxID=3154598 RepID=UPI0033DD5EA3
MSIDSAAAEELWKQYQAARPDAAAAAPDYTVERFGDSPQLADDLLALVLAGIKRATSSLVADFSAEGTPMPRIGGHWIVCDGAGTPRVVLRTTELRIGAFDSVDESFAHAEGEDERTREAWMREHRRYWQRTNAGWTEADEILFERFSVVFPPEVAD